MRVQSVGLILKSEHMAKRLHTLKATEVSPVPRGAINKPWIVLKSAPEDTSTDVRKAAEDAVKNSPAGIVQKVKDVLKTFGKKPDKGGNQSAEDMIGDGLSREAQMALEATGRILAPHKDEITDEHLDAVQAEVGIQGGGKSEPGEDDVKNKDLKSAKEVAEKAYKAEMKKLGYEKYPEAELAMKGGKKFPSDDDDDDDDADVEKAGTVAKETTQTAVAKPILKEDGTLNLDAIPAEMRPFAELIAKQQTESVAKAAASEARAVKLEKELADNKASQRKSEIALIAKGLPNLSEAHVTTVLELADGAGKEKFDAVLKGFEAQNAQIKESKLFSVMGSPLSDGGAGGSQGEIMAKVEKAVGEIVEKSAASGVKISKEQAMSDYLVSHPELYAQEKSRRQNARPDGA